MLLDAFVSCKRIFLVLEYAAKGSLRDVYSFYLSENLGKQHMEEDEARYYFREIIFGLQHLHRQEIAHRLDVDSIGNFYS